MSIKRIKLFLGIFIPFFAFFVMSHNTFAADLQTSSFDLYYRANNNSSYGWRNNITYGSNSPTVIDLGGGITRYQFNTSSVQAGGNYATIHFETNIVASPYALVNNFNPWVNLPQQNILTCSASGIAVVSKNLSYATTYWVDQSNESNNTLTFYGDVVLSGFNPGSSYSLVCSIGSSSYSFIDYNGVAVWFEQNPMSIVWSNDESLALMQTQIEQQNTIINQNETIINTQNQNTEDIINNQNQNSQDIIKSNQNCNKNYLIGNFSQFNNIGGSGSTYGYFKLPDIDDYYLTLIAKNNVTGNGNTFFGFSASGGSSSGGTNWAFNNNSSFSAGQSIIIKNVSGTGVRFNYVSIYSNTLSTFNWFLNNFDIVLTKGSSSLSFIDYNTEVCKNINQEYYDEQRQADDNILNQSSSDIDGATNQQTTNLIGTISSFVSALSSINTNGSCQLTLPFPSLIGGNQVVNPCNGADKAPAIITAASSLLLITVFVPLAFILVKMIYSEIRSFTNG